jgi:hypothetical protein
LTKFGKISRGERELDRIAPGLVGWVESGCGQMPGGQALAHPDDMLLEIQLVENGYLLLREGAPQTVPEPLAER